MTMEPPRSSLGAAEVDHHYVGGYYGAASEDEMKRELVRLRRSQMGLSMADFMETAMKLDDSSEYPP